MANDAMKMMKSLGKTIAKATSGRLVPKAKARQGRRTKARNISRR